MSAAFYPPDRPLTVGEVLDLAFRIFKVTLVRGLPYGIWAMLAGQLANIYELVRGVAAGPHESFGGGRLIWLALYLAGILLTLVAWSGLNDSGERYENFLLVITYWIGPWLGVVFTDRWLRSRETDARGAALLEDTGYRNWSGPLAMAVATVLGIVLFSNQTDFTGLVAKQLPQIGDIAFAAGFVMAAALTVALRKVPGLGPAGSPPLAVATEAA